MASVEVRKENACDNQINNDRILIEPFIKKLIGTVLSTYNVFDSLKNFTINRFINASMQ